MSGIALKELARCYHFASKASARSLASTRRSFQSSAVLPKIVPVPVFKETSSSELNSLLSSLRSEVFIPSRLDKRHQQIVYDAGRAKSLEQDPVTVQVNGEDVRLHYIDRSNLVKQESYFNEALSLMIQEHDFDNLPLMLQAMHQKKIPIRDMLLAKMIRKVGAAGRADVLVDLLRRSSTTSFILKDSERVNEIMGWIHHKATFRGKFNRTETKKAFKLAKRVAILLEKEDQYPRKKVDKVARRHPGVIGILLELAASEAKANHGNDTYNVVRTYAVRFISSIKAHGGDISEIFPDAPEAPNEYEKSVARLSKITPLLYATRLGSEILGISSKFGTQLIAIGDKFSEQAAAEYEIVLQHQGERSLPSRLQLYMKYRESA